MAHRLKILRHFHRLLRHALLIALLTFCWLPLAFTGLRLRRLAARDCTLFFELPLIRIVFVDLTLFDELLGFECLRHLDAQLQMLGNKIFKFLGSHLLALLFVLDVVVMAQNFLARFPVKLNNIGHVFTLALELYFLLADHSFMRLLFLDQVLLADAHDSLRVTALFLRLLVEVVGHPDHLLEQKVPMSFASLRLAYFMMKAQFFCLILKDIQALFFLLRSRYWHSQIQLIIFLFFFPVLLVAILLRPLLLRR